MKNDFEETIRGILTVLEIHQQVLENYRLVIEKHQEILGNHGACLTAKVNNAKSSNS